MSAAGGTHYLVTERAMRRDSRVVRCDLRLRGPADAAAIRRALAGGSLRVRPGVHAWVETRP